MGPSCRAQVVLASSARVSANGHSFCDHTTPGPYVLIPRALPIAQECDHLHDDPEGRAFTQPRHDVAARARGAGPPRLAHDADSGDPAHVRHAVVARELGPHSNSASRHDAQHEVRFQRSSKRSGRNVANLTVSCMREVTSSKQSSEYRALACDIQAGQGGVGLQHTRKCRCATITEPVACAA